MIQNSPQTVDDPGKPFTQKQPQTTPLATANYSLLIEEA
jgi:hypothetical protein